MVFSLILFIIFFSAIILYLTFRIKETFRKEQKRSILITKTVFLIGILFLAGGSFYFFARNLMPSNNSSDNTSNGGGTPQLTLSITYPSSVRTNAKFTMSFTMTNPTEYTAHSVVIQTNLFQYCSLSSSTHQIIGNVIQVGDAPAGNTICSIELTAPDRPTAISDTVTLTFQEMSQPITKQTSITVTGGPS